MTSHCQRVGIAQVDFVLTGRAFVMTRLDADVHLFQHKHRFAARATGHIERRQVEIAAGIESGRALRLAFFGTFKEEKLDFRPDVKREAHFRCGFELLLQNVARIGF